MSDDQLRAVLGAVGLEHVWLGYDYLNRGDADAYASLLDAGARLLRPGYQPVSGRRGWERVVEQRRLRGQGEHRVREVFASGTRIAALGSYAGDYRGESIQVEFADVFTISAEGLLAEQKCFHFTEPTGSPHPAGG